MSTERFPLVSIIIPVYNGSNYLAEAIDSALAQTYKNIEIIVVNDGSNDNGETEKIALSYGNKIKYFYKENGGVSTALNYGIRQMKGEYFSWLSHDDKYQPQKIETQIEFLRKYGFNNKIIAYCNTMYINADSKPLKNIIQNIIHRYPLKNDEKYDGITITAMMLKHGTFNGCAFLIPCKTFDECGFFDETLRYNQDSTMWYSIFVRDYSLVYSDYNGVLSRVHDKQLTQTGKTIFHSDCEKCSKLLIPLFISKSTRDLNLFYLYAIYNAKYKNPNIVKTCIAEGKKYIC